MNRKTRKKTVIIVPAYNEALRVGSVVKGLLAIVDTIIVVDDGSYDQTGDIAFRSGATVIRHAVNLGQGAAIQTGLEYTKRLRADYVVMFDADGQFVPKEIDIVLRPLVTNTADVVLGSRFLGKTVGLGVLKRLIIKAAIVFTNIFSNTHLTDTHNGFRAINKKALHVLNLKQNGMAHASEIIDQISTHKLRMQEVPVTVRYDDYSKQKGQPVVNGISILARLLSARFT